VTGAGPSYAAVRLGLRAPRVVVVFDGAADWHYWARLALYAASQVWGGYGFILIPHQRGVVSEELLNIARAYDPDYVTVLHRTIQDWETISPGSVPLRLNGKILEGTRRTEVLEQVGDSPVRDTDGDHARLAVREVCSSYRRRLESSEDWFEDCSRLYTDRQSRPLTSISDIRGSTSDACLASPPDWGGVLGAAVAAKCGVLERPLAATDAPIDEKTRRQAVLWLLGARLPFPPNQLIWYPAAATSVDSSNLGTAFDKTTYGLVQVRSGFDPNRLALVVGDAADDFAVALAWDRMFGAGLWIPGSWWGQASAESDGLQYALTSTLHEAAYSQEKLHVMSVSNPIDLGRTADALRSLSDETASPSFQGSEVRRAEIVVVDKIRFSGSALSLAVAEQFDQQFALPVTVDREGGRTLIVPPPAPEITHSALREAASLNWQVDLEFWPASMPRGRGLEGLSLLAPEEDQYLTWVRSGRSGISYESHRYNLVLAGTPAVSRLARPRVREFGLFAWASQMASQVGAAVMLSPAGRRAEILRRLWGSREEVAKALSGPLLPILRAFNPTGKTSEEAYPEEEGVVLLTGAREGYLTFEGMIKKAPEGLDIVDLRNIVDQFVVLQVLRRGLILDCEECERPAYYHLGGLAQAYSCPRCGVLNQLIRRRWRKPLDEPRWYYDLHPAVRELLAQHGEVSFVLGEYLRGHYRSYSEIAEFELREEDGQRKVAEADLLALCDGRLIVAEAKSASSLGSSAREIRRVAAKRVKLAATLQADQIVLATTGPVWSEASVEALRSGVDGYRWPAGASPTVRLVTGLTTGNVRDSLSAHHAP
jgi:hypothetical protein